MSHTPAPWAIDLGQLHGNGVRIGSIDDAETNAGLDATEAAANAALICAAPELLDALQRLMRHIPASAGGASLSYDVYRASKAIANATGGKA